MGNKMCLPIRRQRGLYYIIRYILVIILAIYDRLGFFKASKILLKALHHGIIGDLEKDNEIIIKTL